MRVSVSPLLLQELLVTQATALGQDLKLQLGAASLDLFGSERDSEPTRRLIDDEHFDDCVAQILGEELGGDCTGGLGVQILDVGYRYFVAVHGGYYRARATTRCETYRERDKEHSFHRGNLEFGEPEV
jgi:hypothetical protein